MTWHTRTFVDAFTCDATGCEDTITFPNVATPLHPGYDMRAEIAHRAGWTTWSGRQCTRHYCPSHGPKPGHKMRRLLPRGVS